MVGTFLYNCWTAVLAFTIYFFMTFQSLKTPTTIIVHSFIVAIIVFLLTYLVRFLIAFVMYTPSTEESAEDEENTLESKIKLNKEQDSLKKNSNEIPTEDQAEELAKAVKTMMSNDE